MFGLYRCGRAWGTPGANPMSILMALMLAVATFVFMIAAAFYALVVCGILPLIFGKDREC